MRKFLVPTGLGLLTLALAAVAAYAAVSFASLQDDLDDANSEIATLKRTIAKDMSGLRSEVNAVTGDLGDLQDDAAEDQEKEDLAADAKRKVERTIKRDRLIELQKYWQVGDWSVSCVVATPNTLNCLGKGYLDGEASTESYDATVDEDGTFVWKQTY